MAKVQPNSSAKEIQSAIDEFISGLDEMQKKNFNKVYALLKDLSLDVDGNIKPTIENLKVIQRVKRVLSDGVDNPMYNDKVAELQKTVDKVSELQSIYYAKYFKDFKIPKSVEKLNELAFDSLVDQLTGAGVNENVVNMSAQIVEQNIKSGANFGDLVKQLEDKMLGDKETEPKLISYSKQIVNDTLSTFAANYHRIVTDDLNIEWYEYLGALIDTSRPFCEAMVAKKYIHKSEFAGCISGRLLGLSTKKAHEGMMAGTNAENLITRRGGWNCGHLLVGVPTRFVPSEIRRQFEPDVKMDSEEKKNLRPKKK